MRRRDFLALVAGTAAISPVVSWAQRTATIPRVGVLWHAGSAEEEDVYLSVVKKAFSDLGYVEGKTIILEHRFPAEQAERFRSLAQELVDSRLDVIVSVTELGAKELRRASRTIPIVVVLATDPVTAGLADSLAHPGGNVSGLSLMGLDLSGKRLALLKEAVPGVSRVTLMIDPKDLSAARVISSSLAAAKELGLELRIAEASSPAAIDSALAGLAAAGSEALITGGGPLMFNERARIGAFVLAKKLPTFVSVAEMVPFGALLSYGPDFPDYFRRAVGYVDKILKGAKPADLPVEQPSRFKLTINLKAAKMIGISIPTSLLTSADEVIE
ncbi:ABC transporter substrate-binding protein [Bradyrhizobium sp. Tv2a-2]|uniref:ABC transporter substrate-binding protein n=1 Tax=Bradyrhizobium sp. Tv2a-2 TaxID=113395 RepID=UPI00040A71F4|nr:ABC transporter substrate-binding protein [Bradyrhizobium sp. Tv2a-2]